MGKAREPLSPVVGLGGRGGVGAAREAVGSGPMGKWGKGGSEFLVWVMRETLVPFRTGNKRDKEVGRNMKFS